MPTDTSVKFLHSAMAGAPTLTGQAGTLVALLDACLVNGFAAGNVDSIVIAGGVATVTRSAGHPFEVGSISLIAGATVTGGSINGEQRVTAVTSTAYQFPAPGIPDQAAIGSITHKVAPLGWTKAFAATNLAAYKSSDIAATGCLLRVDDTSTTYARVRAYKAMSDVNTGTLATPTDAQANGGLYWPKSSAADATLRPWVLFGDGRAFYLAVAYSGATSSSYGLDCAFGDFVAVKSPDPYGCLLNGFPSSAFGTSGANNAVDFDYGDAVSWSGNLYAVSSFAGYGQSYALRKSFPVLAGTNAGVRSGAAGPIFPNSADGGVYVAPVLLMDHAAIVHRGVAPGLCVFPQLIGAQTFQHLEYLSGVAGYAGKTFRVINSAGGCFAVDSTGPWR